MSRLYLLCVLLLCSYTQYAQNSVLYVQDYFDTLSFDSAKNSSFAPMVSSNFGLDNGIYWFKIKNTQESAKVLQLPSAHIDDVSLYSAEGALFSDIAFTRFPTYSLDKYAEYPLYMRVNLTKEASVPIDIKESASYFESNQKDLFKLGLYYGFALMVILINLMCFVLFDEKVFLNYLVFLSAVGLSYFYSDGLFRMFGYSGTLIDTYIEPLFHIAVGLFGAYFSSNFLRLNEHSPRLKWLVGGLITTTILFIGVYWIKDDYTYMAAANILMFAVGLTYLIAGITLFKSKVYARFYVIAYGLLFVMAADFYVFKSLGLNFLNISSMQLKVASLLEMLVLTYAIMYRMRSIKEEKELMNAEMRIYLKRIEILQRTEALQDAEEAYMENLIDHYDLDATETKLLQYISDGKENSKIARILNLNVRQVEKLTKGLYRKLEISEQIHEDYRMLSEQPDYIYN